MQWLDLSGFPKVLILFRTGMMTYAEDERYAVEGFRRRGLGGLETMKL